MVLGFCHSLIAIYLYTKFDLNVNSSFKVIKMTLKQLHDPQKWGNFQILENEFCKESVYLSVDTL